MMFVHRCYTLLLMLQFMHYAILILMPDQICDDVIKVKRLLLNGKALC